jgi:hypothetical protein
MMIFILIGLINVKQFIKEKKKTRWIHIAVLVFMIYMGVWAIQWNNLP